MKKYSQPNVSLSEIWQPQRGKVKGLFYVFCLSESLRVRRLLLVVVFFLLFHSLSSSHPDILIVVRLVMMTAQLMRGVRR